MFRRLIQTISFLVIFISTAALDMILLRGLTYNIDDKLTQEFFSNTPLSIIVMFWLFLGMPILMAFYFAFKNKSFSNLVKLNKHSFSTNKKEGLKKGIALAIIFLFVFVSALFILFRAEDLVPKAEVSLKTISDEEFQKISKVKSSTQPSIVLPNLLSETIKPKTEIDISSWKTFEDKVVGVRFKYPSEWGNLTVSLTNLQIQNSGTGWAYSVYFSNTSFSVGGTSRDYSAGKDGYYTDFNGFEQGAFWWDSQEKLCQDKNLIFCEKENQRITVVSKESCGLGVFGSFILASFLDRPGKQISGLTFGGGFLSPSYSSLTQAFCQIDDQSKKDEFKKAIKERKLDLESIKNIDTFEKVFETIEEI